MHLRELSLRHSWSVCVVTGGYPFPSRPEQAARVSWGFISQKGPPSSVAGQSPPGISSSSFFPNPCFKISFCTFYVANCNKKRPALAKIKHFQSCSSEHVQSSSRMSLD